MVTPVIKEIDRNDSAINGIYAIGIAFWSTWFVESWKQKEEYLIDSWSQDQLDDLKIIDERKGKYKFEKVYNSEIKQVMYLPKPVKTRYHTLRWTVFLVLITLSAVALGLNEYFSDQAESSQIDEEINPEKLTN